MYMYIYNVLALCPNNVNNCIIPPCLQCALPATWVKWLSQLPYIVKILIRPKTTLYLTILRKYKHLIILLLNKLFSTTWSYLQR